VSIETKNVLSIDMIYVTCKSVQSVMYTLQTHT